MKLIIDIDVERYVEIQRMDWKNPIWASEELKAIHNGVPLDAITTAIEALKISDPETIRSYGINEAIKDCLDTIEMVIGEGSKENENT